MKSILYSASSCLLVAILSISNSARADTPLGWISSANPSAYTTTKGELEVTLATLAVNDSIDFLNIREDLLANTQRLVGDSGDLSGAKFEIHYGITEAISVFYRRQQHQLTVDLGTINSISVEDIDDSLNTEQQLIGFKWTIFQTGLLNPNNRHTAVSIEMSGFSNSSDNFDVLINEINLDNLIVSFTNPQTFSVADLEDEGWKSRLILSWPLQELGIGSIWVGYGKSKATSATTSDISSPNFSQLFEQDFELDQTYVYLGASLNIQLTTRTPLIISYEYININDSNFNQNPLVPAAGLPGFLSGTNQIDIDANHTLNARLSYWLTPQLSLSLSGNLYSNQFLGVLPHYSNPLSGSFSDAPYGFAGVELGYKF